jgi:hypothetical protein
MSEQHAQGRDGAEYLDGSNPRCIRRYVAFAKDKSFAHSNEPFAKIEFHPRHEAPLFGAIVTYLCPALQGSWETTDIQAVSEVIWGILGYVYYDESLGTKAWS